jgi:hypothetical protein
MSGFGLTPKSIERSIDKEVTNPMGIDLTHVLAPIFWAMTALLLLTTAVILTGRR